VPGIGVITNPRSRINKRDPSHMRRLGYLLGSRGAAEATRSLDDLYRVAEEFKRVEIDVLGINGGDGTIHHTLTAFIRTYGDQPLPLIALLRGGTMNTIANSLGIKGNPPKLLFELADRYHNHDAFDVFEHPILSIGDAYGYIFGSGLLYNFLEAYYATGRPSPVMAARLLAKACLSAMIGGRFARRVTRRFHARVIVDGDAWAREDFVTVTAATVEQLGFGFKPFYRVGERPDAFPVLGIHPPSPLAIATELPRVRMGRPIRRDKVIDTLAREVRFEAEQIEYIVDGDLYTAKGSLRVGLGPKLRMVRLTGQAQDALPVSPSARALPPVGREAREAKDAPPA